MMSPNTSPSQMVDRRQLAHDAMIAAIKVRQSLGLDLVRPVCVYDICERMKVTVRFNAINMEGMYDRLPKPRIHLSALRPLVRRNFNCAHELGHHVFGHGSTIDELRADGQADDESPKEVLANYFAAFLLLP